MQQAFYQDSPAVEEMVTGIALDYRLMSQYTSFVAVDQKDATAAPSARPPRRMLVPVPLPEGTRWEGFFGEQPNDNEPQVAAFFGSVAGEASAQGSAYTSKERQAEKDKSPDLAESTNARH